MRKNIFILMISILIIILGYSVYGITLINTEKNLEKKYDPEIIELPKEFFQEARDIEIKSILKESKNRDFEVQRHDWKFLHKGNYVNQTDGFDVGNAGVGNPSGITTNGSDFWVIDNRVGNADFVYHFNSSGDNQTDGFHAGAIGVFSSTGITTNGSDFWIVDISADFVFHTNSGGDNQSDGFDIGIAGVDNPSGITTNGSDFWITDDLDEFVYHFNSSGDNQTDGFDIGIAGATASSGITTNGEDFWIMHDGPPVTEFVYHVNKTGGNITDGFGVGGIGAGTPTDITSELVFPRDPFGITPRHFWIVDLEDDFVYHLKLVQYYDRAYY